VYASDGDTSSHSLAPQAKKRHWDVVVMPVVPGSVKEPDPVLEPMVTVAWESISVRSSLCAFPAASKVAFAASSTVDPDDIGYHSAHPFP